MRVHSKSIIMTTSVLNFFVFLCLVDTCISKPSQQIEPTRNAKTSTGLGFSLRIQIPFWGDQKLAEVGVNLYGKKKYEQALQLFAKAINRNPEIAEYYKLRGKCYSEMNFLDEAIEDFKKAKKKDQKNIETRILLSEALFNFKRYSEAVEETLALDHTEIIKMADKLYAIEKFEQAVSCYTEAIAKNEGNGFYYKKRGICYLRMAILELAILDFKKAVRLDPQDTKNRVLLSKALFGLEKFSEAVEAILVTNDTALIANLGNRLFLKKQYDEALRCYNEAIRRNPSEASYYRSRGTCYARKGNLYMAIVDYKDAVHINPDNSEDRIYLSALLFNAERFNEAIEESLALNDNELRMLGDKLFLKKKLDEALRCYTEAINKSPGNAHHYEKRGVCYWKMEKLDMAIKDFKKEVEIEPGNKSGWAHLVQVLHEAGRFNEAIQETLVLDDTDLVNLGNQWFSREKFEEALRFYTEAIRKNPSEASYYRLRGHCYTKMGNLNKAVDEFKKTVERDPQNKDGGYDLSLALFDAGKFNEALQESLVLDVAQLTKLASQLFFKEKFVESLRCYTELIKKSPENAMHYEQRGLCYWKMQNLDMAILDFKTALRKAPSCTSCRVNLIEVLLEAGNYNSAENAFEKLDEQNLWKEEKVRVERARQKIREIENATENARQPREIVSEPFFGDSLNPEGANTSEQINVESRK